MNNTFHMKNQNCTYFDNTFNNCQKMYILPFDFITKNSYIVVPFDLDEFQKQKHIRELNRKLENETY